MVDLAVYLSSLCITIYAQVRGGIEEEEKRWCRGAHGWTDRQTRSKAKHT